MRVASRYSGCWCSCCNTFASGTRQTGDVYVDTTDDNFYYFDGDNWRQANPAMLNDVGNVEINRTVGDPNELGNDHHLVWDNTRMVWHNQAPSAVSGRSIIISKI